MLTSFSIRTLIKIIGQSAAEVQQQQVVTFVIHRSMIEWWPLCITVPSWVASSTHTIPYNHFYCQVYKKGVIRVILITPIFLVSRSTQELQKYRIFSSTWNPTYISNLILKTILLAAIHQRNQAASPISTFPVHPSLQSILLFLFLGNPVVAFITCDPLLQWINLHWSETHFGYLIIWLSTFWS